MKVGLFLWINSFGDGRALLFMQLKITVHKRITDSIDG